jgi:hypothetical protein
MCWMLQLLTLTVFFGEKGMILEPSQIGLFGENRDYLNLDTPKLRGVILSNSTKKTMC